MDELDDLSICKRIAEIEGLMFCTGNRYARIEIWKDGKVYKYEKFNPLTDDGLCFRLMVKYKVDVDFTGDGYTRAWQYDHNDGQETLGKNPNKVMCLAIIEASK